jgi:hypothetical protein
VKLLLFRVLVVFALLFVFARLVDTAFIRDTIRTDITVVGDVWGWLGDVWDDSKKDRRAPP